ncbi:kinase-like domain-containing protein [Lasiosphaeria hispida]|uniref:non-specific serine/threonine protein kinase n=1 Tax=Lasiosphaeria hispida TaxID=260671 RepID=A0AAJ0HCA4_9PEZI|nr:kinase-like domain-containing protein [Lasiosphaeria hispida]
MSLSLVPYTSREGREVVLRHHNAIVVRDPSSQRLEIRGLELTECPTCHQPLRSSSPERHFERPDEHETFVSPEYFRLLRAGRHPRNPSQQPRPPSSPVRRLVEPVPAVDGQGHSVRVRDAEFVSSEPAPHEGSRIRREAFSPNYFNTFFIEERELGRGGKGVVLLVRHEIDGCHLGHFACKRVPVGDDHAWLEKVLVEVELLAKLSHPNLVSYRHVWLEDVKLNRFGPSVACAFILQQYCNGGDLLNYVIGDIPKQATKEELKAQIRRRSKGQIDRPNGLFPTMRRLPFEEIYSLFKDITSGLAYLHAANYIHRDLKPSNCLLHREGGQTVCLISDFGEVQPENMVRRSTGSTGTISYCAPEVLRKDTNGRYGNFTAKSDVFSLGMILYFMCFGRLPYHNANSVHEELEDIDQLRAEITDWKGFQDERRERPDLPPKLYQLLKKLLSVNPVERPSASEVLGAMKSESGLDGVTRGPRSSSPTGIGLNGRRIQSLDSPMPPGTPVPDPTKHATVTASSDEDLPIPDEGRSPQPTTNNILQKHITPQPSTPRHRGHNHSHSLTLSRSQDGYTRNGSHSPERVIGLRGPVLNGTSASPMSSPATITTPLLMAPPTTRLEQIRHSVVLTWYRAAQWLQYNAAASGSLLRLALLGVKLYSLSWLCWPYTSNLGVLGSVLTLAALDLWTPSGEEQYGLGRRGSRGMVRLGIGGMDDHGYEHLPSGASRWLWGWRRSCTLLAMHFLVLWVTSRSGLLCAAARPEQWADW